MEVVRLYSLPFTESESGVSGEKSYRFRLDSRTEVSVSLTGMNRDIDCRVNSFLLHEPRRHERRFVERDARRRHA